MASTDSRPVPKKNTAFRLYFMMYDSDGVPVTSLSSPDSEVSKDGGAFADCTNEATHVGHGQCYIDLTSTEMNADHVGFHCADGTSNSGEVISIAPEETGDIRSTTTGYGSGMEPVKPIYSGTLAAQTSGGADGLSLINLGNSVGPAYSQAWDGCTIVTTGGAGAGQSRAVSSSSRNGLMMQFTLRQPFDVAVDDTTTYVVYGPLANAASEIRDAVGLTTNDLGSRLDTINTSTSGIKGATFDTSTDSLEALRNRGDAAWVTATGFATSSALAAITGTNGALIGSEADGYPAQIEFTVDGANTRDEYTVSWFKNLTPLSAGITSPTIQVVKRADGTDLIAEASLTQIGSTGTYRFNTTTEGQRLTEGEAAIVIVTATIDGSERTWKRLISRDAEAA